MLYVEDAELVDAITVLLGRFGLAFHRLQSDEPLPGSFWGAPEAGLVGDRLYALPATPLHSILHEACHWICMDQVRRQRLHTDAGGDDAEENAVCYLQILLADALPGVGHERLFQDMDDCGYSFRLGSTRAWFEHDASDARAWLIEHGLIDTRDRPMWRARI